MSQFEADRGVKKNLLGIFGIAEKRFGGRGSGLGTSLLLNIAGDVVRRQNV
jgi:hypothetical protein